MPRPRVHDLDRLLDVAESLVAGEGPDRLTVRGLSAAAGVTNGTIYHAFGSVGSLLGEVWLRAGTDFLRLQRELVDQALGPVPDPDFGTVVGAVVAAADAPVVFADRRPAAARMLLTVKRDRLLGPDLPADLAGALIDLDKSVVSLLTRLAELLWGRRDGAAVEVLTTCVLDLPTALFRRALTGPLADGAAAVGAEARERLAAAVQAVLTLPPPERPARQRPFMEKD